jgi:hypothetical protein
MHDSDSESGGEIVGEVLPPVVLWQPAKNGNEFQEGELEVELGQVVIPSQRSTLESLPVLFGGIFVLGK